MKKSTKNYFPLMALLSPILIFGIMFVIRIFQGGDISVSAFTDNFIFLWDEIKTFQQYVFPMVAAFLVGILNVVLNKISKKRLSLIHWTFLTLFMFIIVLTGSRILFLFVHKAFDSEGLEFIRSGINAYSATLSASLTFLLCGILKYFDDVLLKK